MTGTVLDLTYMNPGTSPVCLFTHVATNGEHFDWLSVELVGVGAARRLSFIDARDKSAQVSVELAPGATFTKHVDLAAWALSPTNGAKPLATGTWTANVTYDSSHETWAWPGVLRATATVVVR
jgi:hypothetical protein